MSELVLGWAVVALVFLALFLEARRHNAEAKLKVEQGLLEKVLKESWELRRQESKYAGLHHKLDMIQNTIQEKSL